MGRRSGEVSTGVVGVYIIRYMRYLPTGGVVVCSVLAVAVAFGDARFFPP